MLDRHDERFVGRCHRRRSWVAWHQQRQEKQQLGAVEPSDLSEKVSERAFNVRRRDLVLGGHEWNI